MDFAKIRPRGGTKAQWEKANPVLAKREIGVQWETTIGVGEVVIKIGDGVTDWINLPEAVKSDITKKIIAALAVVPDDDPDLVDGDSLDTLFGKIAKKFKYLKDNKLDKSARYDGTDSTSTELVPTANALRGVNAKADKNASDITTLNNNLSKCLQYIHSETDVFDFNDPKTLAGYHRLGATASYKNAPSGLDGVNFCTVEVVRPTISDTLAMTIYPYKKGINPPVWYKSGGSNEWPTLPWNVYATKSDLTALTDIILTPANSYSFNADYTYGYKRAGWVEIQFSLASAFDLNHDLILSIPNGCLPKKQVWFPVYESSGGNVIARGNIVGSNIYINGSNSINGKTKLFGHVVYMSES